MIKKKQKIGIVVVQSSKNWKILGDALLVYGGMLCGSITYGIWQVFHDMPSLEVFIAGKMFTWLLYTAVLASYLGFRLR